MMTATEFELLNEWETEQEGGYPEFEWQTGRYREFGEAELAPRSTRVAISPQMRRQIEKHKQAYDRLMRGVIAMRKHVSLRNGRLYFTLPSRSTHEAAAKLGVSHGLFLQIYRSMKSRGVQHISRPNLSAEAEFETAPPCAGETRLIWRWWGGTELWLNDCDTKALTSVMKGGGAVATGACKYLGPEGLALCGLIAGLGVGYAYLIDAVNQHGGNQGVKFVSMPPLARAMLGPVGGVVGAIPLVIPQERMVVLRDWIDQAMAKARQPAGRP